ncbi:hypothetical protein Nepgr_027573 [Nepenthes gracilis]|uniref:Pectinesterase n=1 Tax=Nepenthes gracilis TaxID=150966 RepID=A0AAD3T8S6_NEPGR|nr:hypothetical protein Nepgr_027573 [Nepenthes gracilis]
MVIKAIVTTISILMVVGLVVGVVAVIHSRANGPKSSDGSTNDEKLSDSMKTVHALCAAAMYKDRCIRTLGSVAQNQSSTPQDFVKAGVKISLDQVIGSFNLTDTFVPMINGSKEPERVKMAIEDCKDLLGLAIDKLNLALNQVGDPSVYKEDARTWDLRLWLSDVITYQTNCVDGFEEAGNPELQSLMQKSTVNSTELTMSILDIVTEFTNTLSKMGYSLNTTKLVDELRSTGASSISTSSRRLLGMPVDHHGFPNWMSAGDRHLLAVGRPMARIRPHAVVSLDGRGQFRSIRDALAAYNHNVYKGRYIVYVRAGIYREEVLVDKKMVNIFMYGDGPTRTIVTGNKSFKRGYQTSKTASFNMGFQNTAGPDGHQAVALRVNAEQAVFHSCRFDGYQDTLYTQGGSHFFRECTISGTVDFIFGNGATVIQKSQIIVRLPSENQFNAVTAQGRLGPNEPTGIVLQSCAILPDRALVQQRFKIKTFLGRPWKPYARTVFLETLIGDLIQPGGYEPWAGSAFTDTAFYGEYANRGPGARTNRRVRWKNVRVLSRREALTYTTSFFLRGLPWLRASGVPHDLSLRA